MKMYKVNIAAIMLILMGGFSCTKDSQVNTFQWDDSQQQEEFRPVNQGTKSSYFAIDGNIVSFAVPYLVGTQVSDGFPIPDDVNPNSFIHHKLIWLIMAKGTNVTTLAPIITLAPGATITWIYYRTIDGQDVFNQVDYTEIAEVGAQNFQTPVQYKVITSDGSVTKYSFRANVLGDVLP